jgi:tetratricopeptide (TPR) repeat protein
VEAGSWNQDLGDEVSNQRMGAYRILRAIGRGGMGAVYLAIRDDDQYRQQVAIKIVKRGMDTADVLRRFRDERQILAGLEHPYIARLLDGGCTGDGRPFLVMELVEGQRINDYCRDRNLSAEARCRLFLRVCEAVSYAHRKLVVHRDLKPANILITAEGMPKLLDFGLAKIVDRSGGDGSTAAPFAPLTPEYASPEQIRGGPLSTATDIYSLGVILHELLTGRLPYRLDSLIPGEWERIVCESEVTRPRNLRGDLDNIVMLALRKEADRRYASVDELARDIRCCLESRPVRARPDSLWYRTSKFTRRRRFPLLAAACVLASLVCGMAIAIGQARSAESARRLALARQYESQRARQTAEAEHRRAERERDLAIAERQVAEDRVTQMVNLSDRSLSEVYTLMERLAGGMPARRELTGTTLEFLEKLSKEAGSNNLLRTALAKAYTRLGDIQSDPSGAPMGGWDGAMKSYRAGSALLESALGQSAPGKDSALVWLDLQEKMAMLMGQMGQGSASPALLRRAIAVVDRFSAAQPSDKDMARRRGCLYLSLSKAIHDDRNAARPVVETSIEILSALVRQYPAEPELRYDLSRAHTERAYLLWYLKGAEAAQPDYVKTNELREEVVNERPTDVLYRRGLVLAYMHFASLSVHLNQPGVRRAYLLKALNLAEIDAADPQNLLAGGDYGLLLTTVAALDPHPQNMPEALAAMRQAVAVLEPVVAVASRSPYVLNLSEAHEGVGTRLTQMGNHAEALVEYHRAQTIAETYFAMYPTDPAAIKRIYEAAQALIAGLARAGDHQGAAGQAAILIRRVEQAADLGWSTQFVEMSLASAYLSLADVHRAFGQWIPARAAAQEAIHHASALPTLNPHDRVSNAAMLLAARALLAECTSKLGTDD